MKNANKNGLAENLKTQYKWLGQIFYYKALSRCLRSLVNEEA